VMMTVLSAFLMVLAKRQQSMLRNMGTGWEVPARVINSLINGPGFYVGRLLPIPVLHGLNASLSYDADTILGIALFWFLIGLSTDRRRNKQSIERQRPICAGVLFTFGMLVCGVFGIAGTVGTFSRNYEVWRTVAWHPLSTSDTMYLGFLVWLLVLSGYFARKALIAAQVSLIRQRDRRRL